MKIIGHISTDFKEKFGIPRQSCLIEGLKGRIVFEPEYRNAEAFRGLDEYDYIWVLWHFDGTQRDKWSPTVKPPRLGGNKRMGVFATRSPFRPNPIGMSCVRLEKLEFEKDGPVLYVSGVDMKDGTAIYDIKPYHAISDAHPEASMGFAGDVCDYELEVSFPDSLIEDIPCEKRDALIAVLKQDPRPAYHNDEDRKYGVAFDRFDIRFRVKDNILTVVEVVCINE